MNYELLEEIGCLTIIAMMKKTEKGKEKEKKYSSPSMNLCDLSDFVNTARNLA